MPLHPQQSFEHTLREISVNRDDPCELVRELISNSYDAGARNIYIVPLYQSKGILYFDDGCGLSMRSADSVNGVLPYVAFFSIGKGTKTQGEQIGYKCQGAKLCFASRRFSLLTRCPQEEGWRWFSITDPKRTLNENCLIDPKTTASPWEVLGSEILSSPDNLTRSVLDRLGQEFFTGSFGTGLMLIIEGFEVDNFDQYFSVGDGPSYLREYIRFYTAHADVRRIRDREFGFRANEVNRLKRHVKPIEPPALHLWMGSESGEPDFERIPAGWPYLPIPPRGSDESHAQSPGEVPRLRDGTFFSRHAGSFKHEGRLYNIIMAIDGKRRALKLYSSLSRQSQSLSGIRFSDQRGVILSSQGVRVCQYNQILSHPAMNGWQDLAQGQDHFTLFIDGPFELVTNRNLPAQNATSLLKDSDFVKKVAEFLKVAAESSGGEVLRELVGRIRREATAVKESEYVRKHLDLKESIPGRHQFRVQLDGCPAVARKWFVTPAAGEEHFVGALYTLFASCLANDDPLKKYWDRPITFKAQGIDALGVSNEERYLAEDQLKCIEYKFAFSAAEDFNHPLTLTDVIICWTLQGVTRGQTIEDTFGFQATVGEEIVVRGKPVGFALSDVRNRDGGGDRDHDVRVLSLELLLAATFKVDKRSPSMTRLKGSKSRR